MSINPLISNHYKKKSTDISEHIIREEYNTDAEDILNYNYNTTKFNPSKENNNNLLKTAHFNSTLESHAKKQIESESEEHSYIREMEENMRLFDAKMKKIEKMTNNSTNNLKENVNMNKHCGVTEYSSANNNHNYEDKVNNIYYMNHTHKINSNMRENKKSHINESDAVEESNNFERKCLNLDQNISYKNLSNDFKKNLIIYDSEYKKEEIPEKEKDPLIKLKNEEIKNFQKIIENLKSKLAEVNNNIIKREEDILVYKVKLNEIENDKSKIESKNLADEIKLKNLKNEYINMSKNYQLQKKQVDNLTNKLEESKADNYNLLQENLELKQKLNLVDKKSNLKMNTLNRENSENNQKKVLLSIDKIEKENYFPSEVINAENKNEFAFYEQKLSSLLKQKLINENDLFKLSDKPRTLNEINKKKVIEETLCKIENEIADVKFRLRKLNGKNH